VTQRTGSQATTQQEEPANGGGATVKPTDVIVEPVRSWEAPDLREIWRHRELLYFLAWRDIKVRYKQTLIGAAWAILQPFLVMVVFSLIFGGLLAVPSNGVPYPVFAYAALLPWTFFASALVASSNSLVRDANLITKVYFPRVIAPIAATFAPAVDFVLAFLILLMLMLFFGIVPGITVLALPIFWLFALLTALAFGLWLSALNVKYRDVGYVVPFLIQVWLFLTPVVYPSSIVPEPWRTLYWLNPMAGVVEGFRWALLGTEPVPLPMMLASGAMVILLLVSGTFYFGRAEAQFADVV
jgi:lipopolysaccharide transport system permease protein